jgi:hypothetical protein
MDTCGEGVKSDSLGTYPQCENPVHHAGIFLEKGFIESFSGKFRDNLLNREVFAILFGVKLLIEQWRREYNQAQPYRYTVLQPEPKFSRRMIERLTLWWYKV